MFLSVCEGVDKASILWDVTMCHWVFGSRSFVTTLETCERNEQKLSPTTGFPVSSTLTT
jgi:hypothetical protein